jgi:hypothetical protein
MPMTAAQRKRIPAKDFVYPRERKYPINTKKNAQSALSLAALHGSQLGGAKGKQLINKVYGSVLKKYPALAESDSKTMRAFLRGNKRKNPGHARSPMRTHSALYTHTVLGEQVDTYLTRSGERYKVFIVSEDVELPGTHSSRSGAVSAARAYLKKRKNPGHDTDILRLEGVGGRFRQVSIARIKRMSKRQLQEYLEFRGMMVRDELKAELLDDALADFQEEVKYRSRKNPGHARHNPPNNLFVTPKSFAELQSYIDSTSAPANNMLIATAVINFVAFETGNKKKVQKFYPAPETEAELQAVFNAGVQGRNKKQVGEATTVANMAQNFAYHVLRVPRKNPREFPHLHEMGHKRQSEREAESMVNYDVIYEKKTRKNPTYSTEKTRRWKGVEYVTFYNEDSASPFAWSAWALGFGDLATGRSEAEVIERARGIISAGHKTLEGRKGMAKLYISADEQAAYKRGLHKRKNPAPTRKMAPAVKGRAALVKMAPAVIRSRAALVKKAFALREKTGSRMSPRTIMKDPAKVIRIFEKRLTR